MTILHAVKSGAKCNVIVEPVTGEVALSAVAAVTAAQTNPAILETLQPAKVAGRYNVYAADPVTVYSTQSYGNSPFEVFQKVVQQSPRINGELPFPFSGGWIGYVAYEAITSPRLVCPREPARMPLIRFGFYDHALVHDRVDATWYAVAVESGESTAAHIRQRLKRLHRRVETARSVSPPPAPASQGQLINQALSAQQYDCCVHRILDYIAAGDIYQANLSQRFDIECAASSPEVYRSLREKNPAAFSAYLAWDDAAILSASPELFLQLVGDRVVTRPIKGTRPRTGVVADDARSRSELASSEKEHAELNMIIDLMRNDLGRVCRLGSVEVEHVGEIEAHPTVYHRVATVSGRLKDGHTWADLLLATFPGGSIVGAPKIRAMQILRELEPIPRGPYCGAIGWIGLNGDMTLSMAIRTMVRHSGLYQVHAGGAIVADSRPKAEYAEIKAKARGLFASLGTELQNHPGETEMSGAA